MPLNKELLGAALYNKAKDYNNRDFESIDQARINFWKEIAGEIINHIKNNAVLTVPGTGLASPAGAVTGVSTTGTIL